MLTTVYATVLDREKEKWKYEFIKTTLGIMNGRRNQFEIGIWQHFMIQSWCCYIDETSQNDVTCNKSNATSIFLS